MGLPGMQLDINWSLLKLLYFIETFYPDFDKDKRILEQSLILTYDKNNLFFLYLNKLLSSIDDLSLSTVDIEYSEPMMSFQLSSVSGEPVYELFKKNADDIKQELEDYGCWDDVDDSENDSMYFYISLDDDSCPDTRDLIERVFEKELLSALEGYVYVEFYMDGEIYMYIDISVNSLLPDCIDDMIPLENYIRFAETINLE